MDTKTILPHENVFPPPLKANTTLYVEDGDEDEVPISTNCGLAYRLAKLDLETIDGTPHPNDAPTPSNSPKPQKIMSPTSQKLSPLISSPHSRKSPSTLQTAMDFVGKTQHFSSYPILNKK